MKPFMFLTSASFAASLLLSSCVLVDPSFSHGDESVPNQQRSTGTGVVVGRAIAAGSDGATHVADKEKVILTPKNSVIARGHHTIFVVGVPVKVLDDPHYPKDAVKVWTDGDGNFRFVNIGPGEYVVTCGISYYNGEDVSVDSNGAAQSTPKYDYLTVSAVVSVRNGKTVKVENWHQGE